MKIPTTTPIAPNTIRDPPTMTSGTAPVGKSLPEPTLALLPVGLDAPDSEEESAMAGDTIVAVAGSRSLQLSPEGVGNRPGPGVATGETVRFGAASVGRATDGAAVGGSGGMGVGVARIGGGPLGGAGTDVAVGGEMTSGVAEGGGATVGDTTTVGLAAASDGTPVGVGVSDGDVVRVGRGVTVGTGPVVTVKVGVAVVEPLIRLTAGATT